MPLQQAQIAGVEMTNGSKHPSSPDRSQVEPAVTPSGKPGASDRSLSGELWQSQRIVYIISLILFISMLLASLLDLAVFLYNLYFPQLAWHPTVPGVLLLSLAAVISLVAVWQTRKGRPYLGATLVIGVALFDVLAIALATDLPVIPITIGVIIISIEVAYLTLPSNWMRWSILASLLVGTLSILIWVNRWQPGQVETTFAQVFVLGIITLLVLIFGALIVRNIPSFPLRARVILSFLFVSILPLLTLGILDVRQLNSLLDAETRTLLSDIGRSTAYAVNVFLDDRLAVARTQAQMPDVSDCLYTILRTQQGEEGSLEAASQSDSCHHASLILLSLVSQDSVSGLSYALLDMQGINVVDTRPENIGVDESSWDYYQIPIREGKSSISNVVFVSPGQAPGAILSSGSGMFTPSLYVGVPVRTVAGELVGVLRIQYPAAALQTAVADSFGYGEAGSNQSKDLYVVLLDGETYLRLAHSSDTSLLYKSYSPLNSEQVAKYQAIGRLPPGTVDELTTSQPEVVAGLQSMAPAGHTLSPGDPVSCASCHQTAEGTQEIQGQEAFFTTSATTAEIQSAVSTAMMVPNTSWLVLARQSIAASQVPRQAQTRSLVLLALLTAWVVGGISLVIAQYQTTPILKLTEVAKRVAQGDLKARAEVGSQDEVGVLSATFNSMTDELQETLASMEQRITDRTRAIELSADVSRRLSTILDPAQLVSEVVELLQFAFNYYHVHIYLYDETKENLVMAGGTGDAGHTMLARGHKIERGHGLVGRACEEGLTVLVPDTSKEPTWLPNPLLPETRSEVAVPIMLGDEVLGALDVQQNVVNGLDQQDVELLRGIAGQVAIALRNARQYAENQRLAERQARIADIVEQIQATQTVEEALQIAVREVGRMVDARRTHIRIERGTASLDEERSASRAQMGKPGAPEGEHAAANPVPDNGRN
jgi:putative methionine-R-sulfoxide reductase with GAF domain